MLTGALSCLHPLLVVTSNKPFGRRGEVFGDDVVAAAMIEHR
jgi:hypothetical protein